MAESQQWHYLFFRQTICLRHAIVCGPQRLGTLVDPVTLNGHGPGRAHALGRVSSCILTDTHVGGQLVAAAAVVWSAPSYGLALRVAFGRTQS